MKRWILVILLLFPCTGKAQTIPEDSKSPEEKTMSITEIYAFPAPQQSDGAVFFSVTNNTGVHDRLIAIESPAADSMQFERYIIEDDRIITVDVPVFNLEPGDTLTLEPGMQQATLKNLNTALLEGQSFPVTLIFEKAGRITQDVIVRLPGAGELNNFEATAGDQE